MSDGTTDRDDILLIDGNTVRRLLEGSEAQVARLIESAYETYSGGDAELPHSTFLRFPNDRANRIIALPAYLGGSFDVAGLKWISSFPSNIEHGMDRASAPLTLNDTRTGRPRAILEASSINAHRTAASAAVAARYMCAKKAPKRIALVGCGYIGFETLNYLFATFSSVEEVRLIDKLPTRSSHLRNRLLRRYPEADIRIDEAEVLSDAATDVLVLATSAGSPWLSEAGALGRETVVLNISLRDIAPSLLLDCLNIVDDADHVCRERTSVHLAELESGSRDFISGQLSDLIAGSLELADGTGRPRVFSPFGLGVLDVALGKWVMERAAEASLGQRCRGFFPEQWQPDE
jgi:2,3-diaminopropionate biosynthesis protein SbnB